MDTDTLHTSSMNPGFSNGNSQAQTWLAQYSYRAEEVWTSMAAQREQNFMLEHVPALLRMTATR